MVKCVKNQTKEYGSWDNTWLGCRTPCDKDTENIIPKTLGEIRKMHRREIIWSLLSPQKVPEAQKVFETSVAAAIYIFLYSFLLVHCQTWDSGLDRNFIPFSLTRFLFLKNIVCSYKMLRDNKISPMIWVHTWGWPMASLRHPTQSTLVLCWI